jgi:UDP-N-acetylmuramate-alanine ligase
MRCCHDFENRSPDVDRLPSPTSSRSIEKMNDTPQHVHFLGICGTAMGSVAAAMKDKGFQVTGQDDKETTGMLTQVSDEGITLEVKLKPRDKENTVLEIPFTNIKKTVVQIIFN